MDSKGDSGEVSEGSWKDGRESVSHLRGNIYCHEQKISRITNINDISGEITDENVGTCYWKLDER